MAAHLVQVHWGNLVPGTQYQIRDPINNVWLENGGLFTFTGRLQGGRQVFIGPDGTEQTIPGLPNFYLPAVTSGAHGGPPGAKWEIPIGPENAVEGGPSGGGRRRRRASKKVRRSRKQRKRSRRYR